MEESRYNGILLSDKEERILKMMAAGMKSTEIADAIQLSLPAIKWYRKRLKAKFSAATTGELLVKAVTQKIL